jgi:L-threonylcarbamoyladenylate synthase
VTAPAWRPVPASPAAIAAAAARIRKGDLVVFPTETVYGLGADAGNDSAVAAVFAAKGRPRFNPLIVHVADLAAARAIAVVDARAEALAARFWPGPLTFVLPRREDAALSRLVSAGLDTVAVRAPDHPLAQALLRAAGVPIAAPSANPSGRLSPTRAEHVAASELGGRVAMILDGGPCRVGIESTVVDLSGGEVTILRPGGIEASAIAAVLGPPGGAPAFAGTAGAPLRTVAAVAPQRRRRAAGRGAARLRRRGTGRCRRQSQPQRRCGRGGGQPVRHAARPRPPGDRRHRRDADPRARARPGDQ